MRSKGAGVWTMSRDRSPADVEMQHDSVQHHDRHAFLKFLFGLSDQKLRPYTGAISFCAYLETCFEPLLADPYASMWNAIGKPRAQSTAECWGFVEAACTTLAANGDDISIDEVYNQLAPSSGSAGEGRELCSVAIFSVLCWTTMCLQPQLSSPESIEGIFNRPSLTIHHRSIKPGTLRIENVKRPISAIFRQFHRAMLTSRWQHPIAEPGGTNGGLTSLEVSCLNYACLRDIGKIRLVWVNDLASHLVFDATERTLSVFRFPTFCAMSILANENKEQVPVTVALQKGPVKELYGASAEDADDSLNTYEQVHREVLMSYRLLFGQKRGSRRLARAALDKLRSKEGPQYDPLLDLVCTQSHRRIRSSLPICLWPVTCQSFDGFLQEQSSYSSQDDFLLFGQRLAKLQQFNLHQQPSELMDLWRDRRNPLQWYTFWVVLVVGGATIALSFAQLVVGIVQVVYSAPSDCKC